MLTYQDFLECESIPDFILKAIMEHKDSEDYKIACNADLYDRQKNVTINEYVKKLWTMTGSPVFDYTAANSKIASNFFHRINVQAVTYLLGNGVTFTNESTKKALGKDFDKVLKKIAFGAKIHKVGYGFWNNDRLHYFTFKEFVALYDEETGIMRAGIRFWQLDETKPLIAYLYEEDGYTRYRKDGSDPMVEDQPKQSYVKIYEHTEVDGDTLIGENNYGSLPIVPLWGSSLRQSTLVGVQRAIDSYDLIRSGFANDLTDCAEIYWLVENASGMDDQDLARMRDRLRIFHIGSVDTSDGARITPYTQEIPYQARKLYLDDIRAEIYEGFGALDVHTISAGETNDHIDAAYQPVDEEADDFEFEVSEFIKQILKLIGIEDEPLYKRNRISNQYEQVQMVMLEAEYLDQETVLKKLPNITVDEVKEIIQKKDAEDMDRFAGMDNGNENEENDTEEEVN